MSIFDVKKNGISNMWKIVGKTLNPNKEKSQNMINRLSINGKNITDDHQIAGAMNNFSALSEKSWRKTTEASD